MFKRIFLAFLMHEVISLPWQITGACEIPILLSQFRILQPFHMFQ